MTDQLSTDSAPTSAAVDGEGGTQNGAVKVGAAHTAKCLGAALQAARAKAGLSQRALAKRSHRAHSSLSDCERGDRFASEELVVQYEEICGVEDGALSKLRRELAEVRDSAQWQGALSGPSPPGRPANPPPSMPSTGPAPPGRRPVWRHKALVLMAVAVVTAALTGFGVWQLGGSGGSGDDVRAIRPPSPEREVCARTASVRNEPGGSEKETLRKGEPFVIEAYSENGFWVRGRALHAQDVEGWMLLQNLSRANGSCPQSQPQ
jgi:transcriptional regulator with XRE-family HTH domain